MMTRLAHAWELALWGLQRGEIADLRWPDVNLDGNPKSTRPRNTLGHSRRGHVINGHNAGLATLVLIARAWDGLPIYPLWRARRRRTRTGAPPTSMSKGSGDGHARQR